MRIKGELTPLISLAVILYFGRPKIVIRSKRQAKRELYRAKGVLHTSKRTLDIHSNTCCSSHAVVCFAAQLSDNAWKSSEFS